MTDYSLYGDVEQVPGWLNRVTALRTMDILSWQSANGITGDMLEIGVFCGRYFSLLVDSAIKTGEHVLGIDTFEYSAPERARTELGRIFRGKEVKAYTLWKEPSSRISAGKIASAVTSLRFISIDGAHDYENVYRDLVLCEGLLSPDGIIAVDDFINPLAIGVNQAVNKFLSEPRAVVPAAYIANKLFLAHRSRADDYRRAIEEMILAAEGPECDNFRSQIANGRHHVEQEFYGHKMLLL